MSCRTGEAGRASSEIHAWFLEERLSGLACSCSVFAQRVRSLKGTLAFASLNWLREFSIIRLGSYI